MFEYCEHLFTRIVRLLKTGDAPVFLMIGKIGIIVNHNTCLCIYINPYLMYPVKIIMWIIFGVGPFPATPLSMYKHIVQTLLKVWTFQMKIQTHILKGKLYLYIILRRSKAVTWVQILIIRPTIYLKKVRPSLNIIIPHTILITVSLLPIFHF